jgi:hypothetical protein
MVKVGKIGSKFENTLFQDNITGKMVNQITSPKLSQKLPLKTNHIPRKTPQLPHSETGSTAGYLTVQYLRVNLPFKSHLH